MSVWGFRPTLEMMRRSLSAKVAMARIDKDVRGAPGRRRPLDEVLDDIRQLRDDARALGHLLSADQRGG